MQDLKTYSVKNTDQVKKKIIKIFKHPVPSLSTTVSLFGEIKMSKLLEIPNHHRLPTSYSVCVFPNAHGTKENHVCRNGCQILYVLKV